MLNISKAISCTVGRHVVDTFVWVDMVVFLDQCVTLNVTVRQYLVLVALLLLTTLARRVV